MAKDIIIKTWCDQHMGLDEPQKVEATEHLITLEGRTLTLDLCEQCTSKYIDPLARLLYDHGAQPEQSPSQAKAARRGSHRGDPKGAQCVWCPLDFAASTSSGFMRHIKVVHGYVNAQDAFGTVCAICGQGELYMMMAHVKRVHPEYGFSHTAQVIDWAKHNGDPHGVYAATLARKPSLDPQSAWEQERLKERSKPSSAA